MNYLNKKGVSIFTIDAVVAATILAVGIVLVFLQIGSSAPVTEPAYDIGQNIIDFMSSTKIKDLPNSLQFLGIDEANPSNTIMQQIGEFAAKGDLLDAERMVTETVDGIKEDNYGIEIRLLDLDNNDVRLLYLYQDVIKKDDASLVIPFKKIIYGSIGVESFWSYIVDVKVWQ